MSQSLSTLPDTLCTAPLSAACPTCGYSSPSPGFVTVGGQRFLCTDDFHIRRQIEEAEAAAQELEGMGELSAGEPFSFAGSAWWPARRA
jgi:hypothetical protein